MESLVECLSCGQQRPYTPGPWRFQESGECPRCHYVGWAFAEDVSESLRRVLRERPPEYRQLRTVYQA